MVLIKRLWNALLLFALSNVLYWFPVLPAPMALKIGLTGVLVFWFILFNISPGKEAHASRRLRIMIGGYELFLCAALCLAAQCVLTVMVLRRPLPLFYSAPAYVLVLVHCLVLFPVLFLVILNGFIRMMTTSAQLGILLRVLLLFFWWVPLLNLILIWKVCRVVRSEFHFESAKQELDDLRQESEVCRTKYPIVLVHGIFFRDWQLVNYWGRIPRELIRNGAEIYYGGQQSAAAVLQSAGELKARVLQILSETGAEKVNLIAHSKGGLDARCAISRLGLAPYVASLTTINTPHRGCVFAQVLMDRLPKGVVGWLAKRYNAIFHTLGDPDPDFLSGVTDLRADRCHQFNRDTPDAPGILYQSVMSTMNRASSAPPPLNLTYLLVKWFDKEQNDGLVSLSSSRWGSFLGHLSVPTRRGISHGDIIDLTRENISGFDVREWYVGLVKDLKQQGL